MSSVPSHPIPSSAKADRKAFVDFAWDVYRDDPAWVPPLKRRSPRPAQSRRRTRGSDMPARSSGWPSATAGSSAGSARRSTTWCSEHMGAGTGQWGMFEALDGEAAAALIATAEDWLREQGMTRALGPISLSIWDEPGLEIEGFDQPPTVMMGHHRPEYRRLDRGRRLRQGQGPHDLRAGHHATGTTADRPADRGGRAQSADPHPHASTSRGSTRKRR